MCTQRGTQKAGCVFILSVKGLQYHIQTQILTLWHSNSFRFLQRITKKCQYVTHIWNCLLNCYPPPNLWRGYWVLKEGDWSLRFERGLATSLMEYSTHQLPMGAGHCPWDRLTDFMYVQLGLCDASAFMQNMEAIGQIIQPFKGCEICPESEQTLYIAACQSGRVSIKPPDLRAATRHGPLTL